MTITTDQEEAEKKKEGIKNDPSNRRGSAAIIFTAPLVKQLSSPQVRLPPNYIGVRRVRPSSRGVAAKLLQNSSETAAGSTSTLFSSKKVVFKVTDENGNERRMNSQEKKAAKYKLANEKKLAKKRSLNEMTATISSSKDPESSEKANFDESSSSYHQLVVSPAALEQELAELRGERGGLPPVILSPPMALQAIKHLPGAQVHTSDNDKDSKRYFIMYDDALSQQWAKSLKESMLPAETVREKEDMRPMAYQLTPEAWTRLRPTRSETKVETKIRPCIFPSGDQTNQKASSIKSIDDKREWTGATCRPTSVFDVDISIVFEYLHRETSFYASCGAKFGSDFLIYDGPRDERHAFAGMRILSSAKDTDGLPVPLPLPTAYSLAGYVRCLNTAGKLALLATVVHEQSDKESLFRVALVDVALEKVLTAPTHQRRARTKVRRDVAKNLAKSK
jgi:hypothetical protein